MGSFRRSILLRGILCLNALESYSYIWDNNSMQLTSYVWLLKDFYQIRQSDRSEHYKNEVILIKFRLHLMFCLSNLHQVLS